MIETIEVGDTVNVHTPMLNSLYDFRVTGKPMGEGDAWKLMNNETEQIVYVQHYGIIELVKRGNNG